MAKRLNNSVYTKLSTLRKLRNMHKPERREKLKTILVLI